MAEVKEVKNDFTQGKMWQVILRMAVPMMLAQLVNVLYSVVDRIYIGHIPGVGPLALTGLGLSMPLILIITAFTNLCGQGGGPLCSIARGEGDRDRAERIMANAFTLLLILAVVLTVSLRLCMEKILFAFGASEDTFPYAAGYARIYLLGTVFVMISTGMNSFINAQGFAKMGMLTVLVGAVVNIILDPIFIFALDMGIAGAAWATVIAQACSAAWVLRFLFSDKAILDLKWKNMPLHWDIVKGILALGVTGFVMSFTTGLVQIVCNRQLRDYGGDIFVGAMTVINSVREILFLVMQGLASGGQPVLGYNYGAKAYDRVRSGIRFMCLGSVCYALISWGLTMAMPGTLIKIFNNDAELLAVGVKAMRIYFCAFLFMSLQSSGQSVFVGLGKAKQAVTFSLLRKVFIVVPLVLILPRYLGVYGVFWCESISDLIGGGACFLTMYFTVYRPLGREMALAEAGGAQ